jgi:excisionase family DNA binding protein
VCEERASYRVKELPSTARLLSLPELAELLGVHLATVYKLQQRGELPIPVLRIGRLRKVRLSDVEDYQQQLAEQARATAVRRLPHRRAS